MSKPVVITHGEFVEREEWPVLCEAFEQADKGWGKDRLDAEFVAAGGVLGSSIEVTAGARFEKLEQKILQGWQ